MLRDAITKIWKLRLLTDPFEEEFSVVFVAFRVSIPMA
jgi:hypothetical protein